MNESQLITVPALIAAAGAITLQLEKAGVSEAYSGILALVADVVLCVAYGAANSDNLWMAGLLGVVAGASSLGASVANVRTVCAAKAVVAKAKTVKPPFARAARPVAKSDQGPSSHVAADLSPE